VSQISATVSEALRRRARPWRPRRCGHPWTVPHRLEDAAPCAATWPFPLPLRGEGRQVGRSVAAPPPRGFGLRPAARLRSSGEAGSWCV